MTVRSKGSNSGSRVVLYGILFIAAVLTLVPFILVILTSVRTMGGILSRGSFAIPARLHLVNFATVWTTGAFSTYFRNSVIVVAVVVALVTVIAILAAYAFAFLEFRGKGFLFILVVWGLLVPAELIIIPLFYDLKAIGVLNTLFSLILPQTGISIPFAIFLLRGFMRDIPRPLMESARLDGANEFQITLSVIVPLVRASLAAVIIFTSIWTWNNFIFPMILVQVDSARTLPVGLNYFKGKYSRNYPLTAAAAVISAVPTIIIYFIFQKRIISGMTMGALKG